MTDVYQGMLEAVRAEKHKLQEQFQKQFAKLEERERTILGWREEEGLINNRPKVILRSRTLPGFLREAIQDGTPRSNAELAELAKARGLVAGKVDLRSINAVMLGFMKAKLVQRQNERWIARK